MSSPISATPLPSMTRVSRKPRPKLEDHYQKAVGRLTKDQIESALDRAHEIRRFEIELYWKRSSHFWVMQAAIFTAFGLIGTKDAPSLALQLAMPCVASLGFLTALSGWFAAQGSKFWQQNWERHIDMLEDVIDGPLHKTVFVSKRGVRWSVSNQNASLLGLFAVTWFLLLEFASAGLIREFVRWRELDVLGAGGEVEPISTGLIGLAAATGLAAAWLRSQWTDFGEVESNDFVAIDDNSDQPTRDQMFWQRLTQPKLPQSREGWIKRKVVTGG